MSTTEPTEQIPPFDPVDFMNSYAMGCAKSSFANDGYVCPVMFVHTNNIKAAQQATQGSRVENLSNDNAEVDDLEKCSQEFPRGIVLTIPMQFENGHQKDMMTQSVGKLCEEIDADMNVFVSEIWSVSMNKDEYDASDMRPPSGWADRREAVMVSLEVPGSQVAYVALINRPDDGPPFLDEFVESYRAITGEDTKGTDKLKGRFVGILPANRAHNTVIGDATLDDEIPAKPNLLEDAMKRVEQAKADGQEPDPEDTKIVLKAFLQFAGLAPE